MRERRHATPASSRRRPAWNLSAGSRCERDAHCAATWPRSTPCTGEATQGTWSRPVRTASWSSGTHTLRTRCTPSRCALAGSWPAPMLRQAVSSRAVAWTTSVRFTASRTARVTCASLGNCPATPATCPAVGFSMTIKWVVDKMTENSKVTNDLSLRL